MKRIVLMIVLGLIAALPSLVMAQDHGEVGAYADYFRFNQASYNDNFVGVGGRVSFNMNRHMSLEAEMNYDFARNFTSTSTTSNGGVVSTSFVRTSVRPLTGLFGPKFQVGTGAFRAFVDAKIGFIDYSVSANPNVVSGGTFSNAIDGIGGSGTHLAFFPGGGIEGFWGPIGLRIDAGDEAYLNNGVRNQLRVTFGPEFRF